MDQFHGFQLLSNLFCIFQIFTNFVNLAPNRHQEKTAGSGSAKKIMRIHSPIC